MNTASRALSACVLSFMVCSVEMVASPRQAVPGKNGVVQQWSGRVATLPAPEVTGKGFVTNAKDLALFWRLWKGVSDIPSVDFDKHLIVVTTARSSVLQVRAILVDAKGDLTTVVVATPDMTSDYAVVVTLAERKGVRTVHGRPIE